MLLEETACRVVSNAESVVKRLENAAWLFVGRIRFGRKILNSLNVVVGIAAGIGEKEDSALDFVSGIEIDGINDRAEDFASERASQGVVGIVSAGAVDNDCLKFLVPCGRGGEKRAQVGFGVDAIDSELTDEIFADVVENVGYVSVGAVVADSLPDVRFGDGDEFFVFHD